MSDTLVVETDKAQHKPGDTVVEMDLDSDPSPREPEHDPQPKTDPAKDAIAQIARAHQERDEAVARASAAEGARIQAIQQQAQQRGAALAAEAEAATAAASSAERAYASAVESGDAAAQARAMRELSSASAKLDRANDMLQHIKSGGDPTSGGGNVTPPSPVPPTGGQYTAKTQAWIDSHSKFDTDHAVRGRMFSEHNRLVREGYLADSPAYFRELNRAYEDATKESAVADKGGFTGAPPSRSGGSSGGGRNVVQIPNMGPVTVVYHSNGRVGVSVDPADRTKPGGFEEGARVCHMKLADYVYDLVKIETEKKQGKFTGLITSEGQKY